MMLKILDSSVCDVSLYIYCAQRTCRAQVLTCSAADASLLIYNRNPERVLVIRVLPYQLYGSGRTVAGTVAAAYSICIDYTIVKIDNCVSYLDR